MNKYEEQLQSAADQAVPVVESYYMGNDPDHAPIDGLYLNGNIALSSDLETTAEKAVILAEEMAHHELTVGDILDQSIAANRRQEQKARTLAYDRMIGIEGIARSIEQGCRNRYEAAEYLDVPEDFLQEAIDRYKEIYGPDFGKEISLPPDILESSLPEVCLKSSTTKDPPALSDEEIQNALARIRKNRKRNKAALSRIKNKVGRLDQMGYDFRAAAHRRYLDPDIR